MQASSDLSASLLHNRHFPSDIEANESSSAVRTASTHASNNKVTFFKEKADNFISLEDLQINRLCLGSTDIEVLSELEEPNLGQCTMYCDQTRFRTEHHYFIKKYEALLKCQAARYAKKTEQNPHIETKENVGDAVYLHMQHLLNTFVKRETRLKLFYDTLGKFIKKHGFMIEKPESVYDASLYNCKSIEDLEINLKAENKSGRDVRVVGALAILPSVGFSLPNITPEVFPESFKFRHLVSTIIFMLFIGFIISGTECYRSSRIYKVSRDLEKRLITKTGEPFDLYHLKISLSHVTCMRMALENIILEHKIEPVHEDQTESLKQRLQCH